MWLKLSTKLVIRQTLRHFSQKHLHRGVCRETIAASWPCGIERKCQKKRAVRNGFLKMMSRSLAHRDEKSTSVTARSRRVSTRAALQHDGSKRGVNQGFLVDSRVWPSPFALWGCFIGPLPASQPCGRPAKVARGVQTDILCGGCLQK